MIIIKRISGIYKIINKVNGKIYIGESVNVLYRISTHKTHLREGKHSNEHLQRAWNKYGEENFEFTIIEECPEEILHEREIYYIALYNTQNEDYGYNYTAGGDGLLHPTEETRKKKSESLKKHYRENPEKASIRKQHVAEANRTPEARERQSKLVTERYQNPEYLAKFRARFQEEELVKKMTEINRKHAKPLTEEAKEKLMSYVRKKVMCVETEEIFNSLTEASKSLPGHKYIGPAVSGLKETCGGYHWKYVEE